MENPNSWNPVVTLLNSEYFNHQKDIDDGFIGASLGKRLFDMLKYHGYLSDKALKEEQEHIIKK